MPTYTAKSPTYRTIQEDMWDMIALREYGDEHAMSMIQDANYDQRFTDAFPGDVILTIPQTVTVANNLKAQTSIPNTSKLLPWR